MGLIIFRCELFPPCGILQGYSSRIAMSEEAERSTPHPFHIASLLAGKTPSVRQSPTAADEASDTSEQAESSSTPPRAEASTGLMFPAMFPTYSCSFSPVHPYWSSFFPLSPRRKRRTVFSVEQLQVLEATFARRRYLSASERVILAAQLSLQDQHVKTWFQNRRTKWKKEKAEELKQQQQEEERVKDSGTQT